MTDPYAQLAPFYDQIFPDSRDKAVEFLSPLIPPNSKLADLGCGTGSYLIAFARKGFQGTGIDISKSLLNQAQKKSTEAQLQINWQEGSMDSVRSLERLGLTLILGNSLAHLSTTDEVRNILQLIAEASVEGSWLAIQVINFQRLKKLGVWKLPDQETPQGLFRRTYIWDKDRNSPEFLFSFEPNTGDSYTSAINMCPIFAEVLLQEAQEAGWIIKQRWENWKGTPATEHSTALLFLFSLTSS